MRVRDVRADHETCSRSLDYVIALNPTMHFNICYFSLCISIYATLTQAVEPQCREQLTLHFLSALALYLFLSGLLSSTSLLVI